MKTHQNPVGSPKPPYKLGLLGLIPLVGFFVGIGLILYGIGRYKDRRLVWIGIACILFTVAAYVSLEYYGFRSDSGKKAWAEMAQLQLNDLVKDIEFFKLENGHFPDSLPELQKRAGFVNIDDPLQQINDHPGRYFQYRNLGDGYLLFSSGIDGEPGTGDDLFPFVAPGSKTGWKREQ